MSEHLLFLQAAGSDYSRAHDLVDAVSEVIRASHSEQACGGVRIDGQHLSSVDQQVAPGEQRLDPEQLAKRIARAGYSSPESLLIALAVLVTIASPLNDADIKWIASAAARIGNEDDLLEAAGVIFAFNTINRIADARRVRLEYRFLRELKPIRGWVERRLASLAGLVYDMSFTHQARHSPMELMDRLGVAFERLGAADVPPVFHWLSRSPVVLEGVLEMIDSNITNAGVRPDLLKESAAIAVASRAMPGSGLSEAADQWLAHESLPDSKTLRAQAAPLGPVSEPGLVPACRRYAWQGANAAYTVSDEQIGELAALGLADAEILDLTLSTAVFSALAMIEPISAAVAPNAIGPVPIATGKTSQQSRSQQVQVSTGLKEELAV